MDRRRPFETKHSLAQRRLWIVPALGLVAALMAVFPIRPACAQGTTEVQVTVKDESGNPVVGADIVLTPLDNLDRPISSKEPNSRKTNKKGVAVFPFLSYNAQGEGRCGLSTTLEGHYIRQFKVESRQRRTAADRGAGTMVQEFEGKIGPKQSVTPFMAKPSGTVVVDLVLAPLSEAPPAVSGGAGTGAGLPGASPASRPSDPILAAKALAAQGKTEEAVSALETLAEKDGSGRADFELARLYHGAEKPDEEKAALEAVLRKDPSYAGAHYMLGKLAYQDGKTAEAVKHLEAETAAHPDDATSQATLGTMYASGGRKEDAVRIYEGILAKDSQNADALVALGGLYASQGDLKKSEDAYARVVAIDPANAGQVYFKVGLVINDQKDLTESERQRAADAFKKAIEADPKHAKAHRELGYVLLALDRMDEAKQHFKTYLELTPKAPDATTIRAFLAN